jgi:Fe-S oxidoreductase
VDVSSLVELKVIIFFKFSRPIVNLSEELYVLLFVIHVHGHWHQKALGSVDPTLRMLSLPENYTVQEIPSGWCGMAGSFGYEKEHYEVSMQVGALVFFPHLEELDSEVIIAAPGTSCRHQIHDGNGKSAAHPAEIFRKALRDKRA